jgi:hypothetical protein
MTRVFMRQNARKVMPLENSSLGLIQWQQGVNINISEENAEDIYSALQICKYCKISGCNFR